MLSFTILSQLKIEDSAGERKLRRYGIWHMI
nr:MAG TPA: hypothetical protein [Caudoviricetes sp.]